MNTVAIQQKASLCHLVRATGLCFIEGTTSAAPAAKRDAARLRHEFDCLITLFESGHIDPVQCLRDAFLDPADDASLLASTLPRH